MERKKRCKWIITVAIVAVVALGLGTCAMTGACVYHASVHATNNEKSSLASKERSLARHGFRVAEFEAQYRVERVKIKSTFGGHQIPANYLSADGNKARDTVVMAHGLGGNRLTGYPVAKMLLKHGYNILTYDQRNSGENMAVGMTCGYWESKDLKDCVDYVRKYVPKEKRVGAWGSSIGGATAAIYLGTKAAARDLDFAILDCPVSSMRDIIAFLVRKDARFLPMDFKLAMGDLANAFKLGFSYEDGDVCRYIKSTTVPVLIFNSKKDGVTPYYMGRDLYNAIPGNRKQIVTVTDSKHTDLYLDHPKMYEETMIRFINSQVK